MVRLLAELGAALDMQVRAEGFTAVFVAAEFGQTETVRTLAQLGANIETPNKDGGTPVYVASFQGHTETVRTLAQIGANIDTPKGNFTPVFVAAQEGHTETLQVVNYDRYSHRILNHTVIRR